MQGKCIVILANSLETRRRSTYGCFSLVLTLTRTLWGSIQREAVIFELRGKAPLDPTRKLRGGPRWARAFGREALARSPEDASGLEKPRGQLLQQIQGAWCSPGVSFFVANDIVTLSRSAHLQAV